MDFGFFSAPYCKKDSRGRWRVVRRKGWNNSFQLSHTDTGAVWGIGEDADGLNFLQDSATAVCESEQKIAKIWGDILEIRQYFKELHKKSVVEVLLDNQNSGELPRLLDCLHFLPEEYRNEILAEYHSKL